MPSKMVGTNPESESGFASRISKSRRVRTRELRPAKNASLLSHGSAIHQSDNPLIRFRIGVPSRDLTGNLELRTLPLCSLSYGDDLDAECKLEMASRRTSPG